MVGVECEIEMGKGKVLGRVWLKSRITTDLAVSTATLVIGEMKSVDYGFTYSLRIRAQLVYFCRKCCRFEILRDLVPHTQMLHPSDESTSSPNGVLPGCVDLVECSKDGGDRSL